MKKIITTLTALVMTTSAIMAQSHTVITPDQIKWGMLNPARGDQSPKAFDTEVMLYVRNIGGYHIKAE